MNIVELAKGLNAIYPTRYSHFVGKVGPPYITYVDDGSENLVADNIVVEESNYFRIYLYTKIKDLQAERKIKDFLTENEIPYETDSMFFLEDKSLFVCTFSITLIN